MLESTECEALWANSREIILEVLFQPMWSSYLSLTVRRTCTEVWDRHRLIGDWPWHQSTLRYDHNDMFIILGLCIISYHVPVLHVA